MESQDNVEKVPYGKRQGEEGEKNTTMPVLGDSQIGHPHSSYEYILVHWNLAHFNWLNTQTCTEDAGRSKERGRQSHTRNCTFP